MPVSRCVRAGGALGHLLLVVVLALGVFVMHTLGHPDGSTGSHGMGNASHSRMEAAAAPEQSHAADRTHTASPHEPAMAMDMLSLCMAVLLGAWVLAALLRSALARRPDWLADLLRDAPVVLRPNPPPRGPDLTQLSVLRL
ncbi:DUF6153 family protein [Streptomyces sp. NPDC048415]|uniref:DUF6153 family protein n=1 Tax=Streptomyces sp. NPDC048415 TaxID=3154822 RepID=UPI003429E015